MPNPGLSETDLSREQRNLAMAESHPFSLFFLPAAVGARSPATPAPAPQPLMAVESCPQAGLGPSLRGPGRGGGRKGAAPGEGTRGPAITGPSARRGAAASSLPSPL